MPAGTKNYARFSKFDVNADGPKNGERSSYDRNVGGAKQSPENAFLPARQPLKILAPGPAWLPGCVHVYLSRLRILRVRRAALALEIGCCYDAKIKQGCCAKTRWNEGEMVVILYNEVN